MDTVAARYASSDTGMEFDRHFANLRSVCMHPGTMARRTPRGSTSFVNASVDTSQIKETGGKGVDGACMDVPRQDSQTRGGTWHENVQTRQDRQKRLYGACSYSGGGIIKHTPRALWRGEKVVNTSPVTSYTHLQAKQHKETSLRTMPFRAYRDLQRGWLPMPGAVRDVQRQRCPFG